LPQATSSSAAGTILKVKIANRPKSPDVTKIKIDKKGILKGVTEKMEYSTDGITWKGVAKNPTAESFTSITDIVYFRIKATNKAMKSLPTTYQFPTQ